MDTVKWRDGYRQEGCSLFARSVQAACGTLPSLDSNKEEVQPVSLLFLGFQTAAVLAERNARREFKDFLPSNVVLLSQASRSRTEIISHDLSEYGLTDRGLDVIVPRDASRDPRSPLRYHRGHPLFPSGSFLRGRGGIFIASPALSLLQLSLALDECSWLKLAYRFTGTFSLDESAEDGIVERPPLASTQELEAYFSSAAEIGIRGARRSCRLLRQVRNGSASPMESELEIALSRPRSMSGYGCVHATLNDQVRYDELARNLTGHLFARIDLHYQQARYGLEYSGRLPHQWQVPEDVTRQNALAHMGEETDFVTYRQLSDARELELVARKVTRKTRRTWRENLLLPLEQRQAFLDELLREKEFETGAGVLRV